MTIEACKVERIPSDLIFLINIRSSLDQSDGREGITALTCIMQGHLRLHRIEGMKLTVRFDVRWSVLVSVSPTFLEFAQIEIHFRN
jgi:hypothetical protein